LEKLSMRLFAVVIVACLVALGCDRKPPPKVEGGPGIEVNAPGVHVEAGGGKGTEVEAPGVDVKAQPAK
jgi:hypothetical protein